MAHEEFESTMQEIAIITGATEEEIAQLKEKVKSVSVKTACTAEEVGRALKIALRGMSAGKIARDIDDELYYDAARELSKAPAVRKN